MRSQTASTALFWGLATVLLAAAPLASAQIVLPPAPLWHFAVRSADETIVLIAFPKTHTTADGKGPFALESYVVERSDTADFADVATVTVEGALDNGESWVVIDGGWTDVRPYYRVRILSEAGDQLDTSTPRQAADQKGNIFVVAGTTPAPGTTCGDLSANPCPDLRTALRLATPGSTIYLTPGIYTGPGNTNLTYGGKAVTIESTSGRDITLINATDALTGKKTRVFAFDSGEGRDSVLSGVTISGGETETGGCISIRGASPTIRDSQLFACNATIGLSQGGAIHIASGARPRIENTKFIFNWAAEGGAIFVEDGSDVEIDKSFFLWNICASGAARGGAVSNFGSNVTMTDSVVRNGIVGNSGGAAYSENGYFKFERTEFFNCTAFSFGGVGLFVRSKVDIINCNVTENRSQLFGGGMCVSGSDLVSLNTTYDGNTAGVAGGALKTGGGLLKVSGGYIRNSKANMCAALDIASDGTTFSGIEAEDVDVYDNISETQGAGFWLDSFDVATFRNVRFRNNSAPRGAGGWCPGRGTVQLFNTTFEDNNAQYGAGVYVQSPCRAAFDGVTFRRNSASGGGGGIVVGDGAEVNVTRSLFESNGRPICTDSKPPLFGGALVVGLEKPSVQVCGIKPPAVVLAKVAVTDSSFVDNVAQERGGAVAVESGALQLTNVEVEGNRVLGGSEGSEGVGGGVAVVERCVDDFCSPAIATIDRSRLADNTATSAGGALHFAGGSYEGGLVVTRSNFSRNTVAYETGKASAEDGVGGAIYLGRSNFTLTDLYLGGNEAYYGGALFVAANLSAEGARLSKLRSDKNSAVVGPAAFWLRSASPSATLPLDAFSVTPADPNTVATEVLTANFVSVPPSTVRSAEEAESFSVAMLDFYGNVGVAELGSCVVSAPNTGVASNGTSTGTTATVRTLGSDVGVTRGGAVFSQLEVTGTIGESYKLQVECTPNSLGRSRFLNMTGAPLPALAMPVNVAPCSPGSEPKSTGTGSICVECAYGSWNTDGLACEPCPRGAVCSGGSQVTSQENWWRSSMQSEEFFSCRNPDVCMAGPVAGDEACVEGHEGPLCAVCTEHYFFFAGSCEACNKSGQAKAMLALSVILLVCVLIFIFVVNWEFGDPREPGLLTKIKILITHFQLLALFRDYDVLWPSDTMKGLSWFDTVNFGIAMMAPECFWGGSYSFWAKWIFQMLLPVGAVALSVAVYFTADALLKRRAARAAAAGGLTDTRVEAPEESEGSSEGGEGGSIKSNSFVAPGDKVAAYLAGLKIRSWKNAFWLVTLLYPRSSTTALQMFSTQTLDIGTYLTADYSIQVKAPGGDFAGIYIRYMIPGATMLFIFAVVVPGVWFYITWKNRHRLDDMAVAKRYGFLYGSYSRRLPFWETVEVLRKFAFAFIPVFIPQNSVGSVQGTLGQILACGFLSATVWLRPYASAEDNHLMIASQAVLFLVLLSGTTAKWADISSDGMRALAAVQLLLTSGVAFAAAALIGMGIMRLLKHRKEVKAAKAAKAAAEGGDGGEGVKSKSKSFANLFNLTVRAGEGEGAAAGEEPQERSRVAAALGRLNPRNCMGRRAVADEHPAAGVIDATDGRSSGA